LLTLTFTATPSRPIERYLKLNDERLALTMELEMLVVLRRLPAVSSKSRMRRARHWQKTSFAHPRRRFQRPAPFETHVKPM